MLNIIFPVIDDFESNANYVKNLKISGNILVGVTEAGAKFFKFKKSGIKVKIFKDVSHKEEIINSLQPYLEEGKILILRKQLTSDEISKFFSSKTDITICAKKKRGKIGEFFYRLWEKIIRVLFDLTFFDGDISAISFSEKLSSVVQNIPNLSSVSRVNRWKGVSVGTVTTTSKPAKKEYSKIKNNIMLIGWTTLFLGVIASITVYYIFKPVSFLSVLLWLAGFLVAGLGVIIAIAVYFLTIKSGKRYFSKAEEV